MKLPGGLRAWTAAAILFAAPALAQAQQNQQQYGGPGNTYTTWGSTPQQHIDLTYFVGPSMTPLQTSLIQQAAAGWNSAGSGVRLVEVFAPGANITWTSAPLGITPGTVAFAGLPTPGAGTYPNGAAWSQLNGPATITVNSSFQSWDGVGPLPGPLSIDFTALSLNFFGRAMGLGFAVSGEPSVMQPDSNIFFNTPGQQFVTTGDSASLQAVYGTPEPATLALFGIGLALFGGSRKFRRSTLGL